MAFKPRAVRGREGRIVFFKILFGNPKMKFYLLILFPTFTSLTAPEPNHVSFTPNPLCGNSTKLLYHAESRKCYLAFMDCAGLMTFYATGDGYGECDCETKINKYNYRNVIYWRPHNRCYPELEKGPCRRTEYLTMDEKSGTAVCEPNPCYRHAERDTSGDTYNFWFYRFDKCWKTGTPLPCRGLDNEEITISYHFPNFDKFGRCTGGAGAFGGITSYSLPCFPGHKYFKRNKICKRAATFKLNFQQLE